tara:strand:- start:501 stop:704 length:204 start_codon:yes stop_codon:yes gene_type:complete
MQNSQEIRELAYYLWISEGKPDGQANKHWQMAIKLAAEQRRGRAEDKTSTDPSEAKGLYEPAQPDQT